MRLEDWLKIYEEILRDFGFSKEKDYEAAKIISELGKGKILECDVLNCIQGKEVAVVGGAYRGERIEEKFRITAGKAVERVDFIPEIHVTDLDESIEKIFELERSGCILVIHAHGDNIETIRSIIPKLKKFVATTQVEPFDKVYNFTGFTDGDRAAIIAKKFGAKRIRLYGFDFKNANGLKLKKLKWAEKILRMEGLI